MSVSRFVWEGTIPSPSVVAGVRHAVRLGRDEHHTTKKQTSNVGGFGQLGPTRIPIQRHSLELVIGLAFPTTFAGFSKEGEEMTEAAEAARKTC